MKIVVLAIAAAALAGAAPNQDVEQQPLPILREEGAALVRGVAPKGEEKQPIQILLDERVVPVNGIYAFQVETENGIVHSEEGVAGVKGQTNVKGSYSYVLDDGSIAEVRYTADENGFRPESPLLPVAPEFPHPIPQYVLDQIAFGEELRRQEALRQQEEAKLLQQQVQQEAVLAQQEAVQVQLQVQQEETQAVN